MFDHVKAQGTWIAFMQTSSQTRKKAMDSSFSSDSETMDYARTAVGEASREFSRLKINDNQADTMEPAISASGIRIKPSIILKLQDTIQFGGSVLEDPNLHLRNFEKFITELDFNIGPKDLVKLRLFPFTLRDVARSWFLTLSASTTNSWNQLEKIFCTRFYPLIKVSAIRNTESKFSQLSGEYLCLAWDRFKKILENLNEDGMPPGMAIHYFYRGLNDQCRAELDVAAGGSLWSKSFDDAYELIENLTAAEHRDLKWKIPKEEESENDEAVEVTQEIQMTNWHRIRAHSDSIPNACGDTCPLISSSASSQSVIQSPADSTLNEVQYRRIIRRIDAVEERIGRFADILTDSLAEAFLALDVNVTWDSFGYGTRYPPQDTSSDSD
ncbi:hypothetical protein ACET3Z_000736 [Daucus carota]